MKATEYDSNDEQEFSDSKEFEKHGMIGEAPETDESDDDEFDLVSSRRLPSQHSRRAIGETLRWMGCGWGE